jgi:hypothetical protein
VLFDDLYRFDSAISSRTSALDQFHCCFQLTWAAIQVRSSGTDAAMTSKRFQNVDGSAFVGKIR